MDTRDVVARITHQTQDVDHLLDSGELVRPVPDRFARTQSGYYLLKNRKKKPFPEQKIVEEWLLGQSAARKKYAPRVEKGYI